MHKQAEHSDVLSHVADMMPKRLHRYTAVEQTSSQSTQKHAVDARLFNATLVLRHVDGSSEANVYVFAMMRSARMLPMIA